MVSMLRMLGAPLFFLLVAKGGALSSPVLQPQIDTLSTLSISATPPPFTAASVPEWMDKEFPQGNAAVDPQVTFAPPVRFSFAKNYTMSGQEMPVSFSWRTVQGMSLVSPVYNQHIPQVCGACWAFSALSVLSDRHYIKEVLGPASLIRKASDPKPEIIRLSVQSVIGCAPAVAPNPIPGNCKNGSDALAYQYAMMEGVPDDTCSTYTAEVTTCNSNMSVSAKNKPKCYTCWTGTLIPAMDGQKPYNVKTQDNYGSCVAIPKYKKMFVSEIYSVQGAKQMRDAIYAGGVYGGPISCSILASGPLESYGNPPYVGTLSNATLLPNNGLSPQTNHFITVTGWGRDAEGNDYWEIRNSWGRQWGNDGYMHLVTSDNKGPIERLTKNWNNNVEMQCYFGVPDRFDYD